jgi:DNA repair protein RadC
VNGRRDLEEALSVFLSSRRKARSLLARTTLRHLAECDESELARFMPRDSARSFASALLLAREATSPPPKTKLDTPSAAYAHLYPYLAGLEAERFVVVACDIRAQVLATSIVAEGTPDAVSVHPGDVFAVAVRHRAVAVVVAHNHPLGVVTPSAEDLELTEDLRLSGKLLGIPVIDHMVVAGDRFWSIAQNLEIRVRIVECSRPRR